MIFHQQSILIDLSLYVKLVHTWKDKMFKQSFSIDGKVAASPLLGRNFSLLCLMHTYLLLHPHSFIMAMFPWLIPAFLRWFLPAFLLRYAHAHLIGNGDAALLGHL